MTYAVSVTLGPKGSFGIEVFDIPDPVIDLLCEEAAGYDYWPDHDDPAFFLDNIMKEVESWEEV